MQASNQSLRCALILAGGRGTRLQSVVSDRPKPMAVVNGRPFLEWLILHLRKHGVCNVVLSTGHLGGMIEDHFGDGRKWDMRIVYSHEQAPLGTGGAIRHALPFLTDDCTVALNGDSFCPFDPERF